MSYRKIQIEVFCYGKVEEEIKKMNVLVKKIGAEILVYRTYAFSGMAFF